REIYAWSKLRHENIQQLLGLATFRDQVALLSPWMDNGSLADFLIKNPDVGRSKMCLGIAEGLAYMHSQGVVHGDLKAANVLVSNDLTVKITDFGSTLLSTFSLNFASTDAVSFSLRWAAPELILSQSRIVPTTESDVYSLGMVI
ncbi:kinase-like protein, partial [Ceratobasidium sp. AG-I]